MTCYRETLSIGGIGMAVESALPFHLSDHCQPFALPTDRPDVVFRIEAAEGFDDRGLEEIWNSERRTMYRRGEDWVYLCHNRDRTELRWFTCWTENEPDVFRVHIIKEEVLNGINPLIFVELSDFMIRHEAMILHSSLISCRNRGIVFTAPSGTGKSTQAELWKTCRGAEVLNGDRSIIRRQDGYWCYGSPYAGSSGIYENKRVKLTAIVVLRQAKENKLRRLKAREACLCLLSEMSMSPISREVVEEQSKWLLELIGSVPVYLLECLPDQGAVELLYKAWEEDCHGEQE